VVFNNSIHKYADSLLPNMDQKMINSINLEASKDFADRTSPGSIIIFLLLLISGFISDITTNTPLFYYSLVSFSFSSIILHFLVLRTIHKQSSATTHHWEIILSLVALSTAVYWGIFISWSLILYGINITTLVFLLFTVGIGSGSAVSIFIRKRVAILYLLIISVPTIIFLMTFRGDNIALGLTASFIIYFLYLILQVHRSNGEYWKALINTRQLEIQAQELEKANQTKSIFLANMSHELRTPLNAILGFSQLLNLDKELSSKNKKQTSEINKAGLHLLELINEILDLSKIEGGHLKLEKIEFDLFQEIDELTSILAPTAYSKSLDFEVFIDPAIPRYVIGDSLRIKQILTNFIGNAVKFTDKGQVSLAVSIDNSGEYLFEVHDEGIGIPQKIQPKLFQPFTQADDSSTRRFGGTGLGLAISAQFVKAMEGSIGIKSLTGTGSTFWFKLPLPTIDKSNQNVELSGKQVLFIGQPEGSSSFKAYLESWGARCDSAQDMTHAESLINKSREKNKEYALIAIEEHEKNIDIQDINKTLKMDDATAICLFSSKGNERVMDIRKFKTTRQVSLPLKLTELFDFMPVLFSTDHKDSIMLETVDPLTLSTIIFSSKGKKVLIVEDDEINQLLAENMLTYFELNVTIVSNGEEAVEILETEDFDLILMDIQMPVMNGYDATRKIREKEKINGKKHPIIAMTADAMIGVQERCLTSGMDDYISKPINLDKLQEKIKYWLT